MPLFIIFYYYHLCQYCFLKILYNIFALNFISVGTRKQFLKVYYPPQDVTVGDGNNINLKCIFIGPEDVKISWIKRAGSLSLFARVSYRTKVIKRGFILVRKIIITNCSIAYYL